MRSRAAWVLGLLAAAVVALRALGRRRPVAEEAQRAAPEPPDTRAEELRRKLEESRELEQEREAFEEGEVPVDRAGGDDAPEDRRREVHAEGRAAVDEMRRAGGS